MAKKKRTTTKVTPLTLARQRRFETPNEHEEEEDEDEMEEGHCPDCARQVRLHETMDLCDMLRNNLAAVKPLYDQGDQLPPGMQQLAGELLKRWLTDLDEITQHRKSDEEEPAGPATAPRTGYDS